jgi:serine protease Do
MRLLVPLLCAAVTAGGELSVDVAAISARVKPSVVLIEVLDARGDPVGNGTGFFVSADGQLATNLHVIERAHAVRVVLADGTRRKALGVLAQDAARDAALLQIEGEGYPALPLARETLLSVGARVVVVGSPLGLASSVSDGIVAALDRELPERFVTPDMRDIGPLIQITAPISPGSSGSPVVDTDGRVVGMAQSIIRGAANVGFALPVEVVASLQASVVPGAEPRPFRPFPIANAVASGVFLLLLAAGLGALRLRDRRRRRPAGPRLNN